MVKVCGIDEAGRGPLIGPLVIAGVVVDSEKIPKLRELGVKDSKMIAPKKREAMFGEIIKIVDSYEIIVVNPDEVDDAVESDTLNLNWLEAIKSAMIINKLGPDKAILDAPSNNTKAYSDYLRIYLKKKEIELVCEHKADENYLEVGAASILAKVTRDKEVKKLREKYGDLGSGYPADPKTKDFLMKNWKKHMEIFRKSWASYKRVAERKKQKSLGNY